MCCVDSGLCDGLITRTGESYQMRVCVCNLDTSKQDRLVSSSAITAHKLCLYLFITVQTLILIPTFQPLPTHLQTRKCFICGNKMPTRCNRRIFIADLIACSTCFGDYYAYHQELESIIQVVAACPVCANRTHNPQLHTIPTT